MATFSHNHTIYRGVHQQTHPSDNDPLYAGLTTWHFSQPQLSQASGPSSAVLHRSGPSAAQRQLPAFSRYDDYVSEPSFQTPWSHANYHRSGWADSLADDSFTPRLSVQYGTDAGNTASSVPQSHPSTTRPYAASREEPSHFAPDDAYRAIEQRQEFHLPPVEFSATQTSPPSPTTLQHSAPVARPLNDTRQSLTALHVHTEPLVSQTSMRWPLIPAPTVSPTAHQFSQGHTSAILPSVPVPGPENLVSSQWTNVNIGPSNSISPILERLPDQNSGWTYLHAPIETGAAQLTPSSPTHLDHESVTAQTAPRQRSRRSVDKLKPKMPSSYTARQEKVKVSKRRGPLEKEKRDKAHLMRQNVKVCVRCKMYKAGCDDGHPCQKCAKTAETARSFLEPCFRDHLEDTFLVRRCNGRCNQLEADFLKYPWREGGNIHTMEISWNLPGFGPIRMDQPLRVRYREYYRDQGATNHSISVWTNTDGQRIQIEQPPYAVFDNVALQKDVDTYLGSNTACFQEWIYGRTRFDKIALLTYKEALRLRHRQGFGSDLLDHALHLQFVSIMSQGYGTVFSANVPGIKEVDFKKLGHSGYEAYDRDSRDRPLPAAISHQMDVAFVKSLRRLEHKCQKLLTARIFKPKIKPWYELFLTFFILLWNLEYIHGGADKYRLSKSGTNIQNQVNDVVGQQLNKWNWTSEVLLKFWRTLLRGFVPFKLARENPEELRDKGHLPDGFAFEYMMEVVALLDKAGPDQFPPPYTGIEPSQYSIASKWVMKLLKQAGA